MNSERAFGEHTQSQLQVKLLGGFRLALGQEPVAAVNTPRLQSLLAYLVLRRGVAQSRQSLAYLLWPESSDAQARSNLRTLLHRLATALPQSEQFLNLDSHAVTWIAGSAYRLDVDEFEAAIAAAKSADEGGARIELERAIHLFQGELFPECYDDWITVERQRLHQQALGALDQLVALLERRGQHASALERAQRSLQLDPLRESTYLALMRLQMLQGERAGALRVYHQCAALLRDELGVEPGAAMRTAYADLMAGESAVAVPVTPMAYSFPLVGREAEQSRVRSLWHTAAQGRPTLLVVSGEAGLGKTRLAEDVLAWAERQGAATAIARCYAAEGDLAFAPVTAWLRSGAIRPNLARLEATWLAEVARLAPEVMASRPDVTAPGAMTEGWQRHRFLEAMARAMLAGDHPLLLMIDDLQWCDPDTLEWIQFLLHHAPRARLLILATLRPDEAELSSPLGRLLSDLPHSSQLTQIALQPLTATQTAELARFVSGRELAADEAAGLYVETEGNPFFIVETLQVGWLGDAVRERTGGLSEPAPLPPGVQSVMAHRLGQISPAARELLGVAAVIGRSFNVRVLSGAADIANAALMRSLDELWRRRMIREQGTDAYDFSHDKLRAAAYAELSPARRKVLHRRAAEAIEADPATNRAASGQIAAHYEQAGQAALAAGYYSEAANLAHGVFANKEAIGFLRRALTLLDSPMVGSEQLRAAGFSERLGVLLHMTGQLSAAREAYQRSLDLTPLADGPASDTIRADLQRRIGNTWRDGYQYAEAYAAYDQAAAELRLSPGASDAAQRQAWLLIQLDRLQTAYWLAETATMFDLLAEARPIAERYGSLLQRARISQFTAWALVRRDGTASEATVQAMAEYLSAVEESGTAQALPAARFQFGIILVLKGELDRAEPELAAALDAAERTGDISLEARCLTYLTMVSRRRQQIETVRTLSARSLQVAETGKMPDYIGAAKANQAWLAWRAGDRALARTLGQQALKEWAGAAIVFASQWLALWPLLALALAEGQLADATAHARALLDSRQNRPPLALQTALAEAIRCADAGDEAGALAGLLAVQDPAASLGYL